MGIHVHAELVDADDAALIAKERPLHGHFLVLCLYLYRDEICKVLRFLVLRLRDLDVALLGKARRIDVIYLALHDGVQHALDDSRREKPCVDLGDFPVVGDFHALDGAFCEGADRSSDALRQIEIGPDDLHDLRGNRRHIDRRGHRLALECRKDALRHVHGNPDLRLHRRCAEMRREDDAGNAQQRMIRRNRLTGEHVDCRACHDAILHRLGQIRLVDDASAGTVHKAHALLHLLHLFHGDHALGLRSQRHMHRDEVCLRNHIIQGTHLDTKGLRTLLIDIGIIGDDIHVKGQGPLCNAASDTPHSDNAESLSAKFHAHIFLAVPFALLQGLVGNGDMAGHGEHHGHGMLRGCDGVAAGGVDDDDASCGCRRNVDVVHADAGPADDLEFLRTLDDIRRDLGSRADHQRIKLRNDGKKLLMGNLLLHYHFELLLQKLDTLCRNTICCQNLHNDSPPQTNLQFTSSPMRPPQTHGTRDGDGWDGISVPDGTGRPRTRDDP